MIDDPFLKAEIEEDERERRQGCICEREAPRGKIDKMQGRKFKPNRDCPLHGWMVK